MVVMINGSYQSCNGLVIWYDSTSNVSTSSYFTKIVETFKHLLFISPLGGKLFGPDSLVLATLTLQNSFPAITAPVDALQSQEGNILESGFHPV